MTKTTIFTAAATLFAFGLTLPALAQTTLMKQEPVQQYQAGGGSAGKDQVQQYQAGGGAATRTGQYKKGAAQSLAPSSATPYQSNDNSTTKGR